MLQAEEAAAQERMQETVLELDNQLNQVRKEYDTLCIEFEQSNAANEQAGVFCFFIIVIDFFYKFV